MSVALQESPSESLDRCRVPAKGQVNVARRERWISSVFGLGCLAYATRRGGQMGLLAALVGGGLLYRGVTGRCSVYRAIGKRGTDRTGSAIGVRAQRGVRFEKSIVISRPPLAIYSFWRKLSNLPTLIDHLESVVEQGRVSFWTARAPFLFDRPVKWVAEIIDDRPGELIAWRSLPDESDLDTAGSFHLQPLDRDGGTTVRLILKYDPPAGRTGDWIASWLGADVESELAEGLRRMKQVLETGEIPTTRNQPHGS